MKPLVVSKQAEQDLADLADYIAFDFPRRALSFVEEIEAYFDQIGDRPLSFSPRPEWGSGKRSAVYGRYVVIFQTNETRTEILRVVHGARDIDELF